MRGGIRQPEERREAETKEFKAAEKLADCQRIKGLAHGKENLGWEGKTGPNGHNDPAQNDAGRWIRL